MPLSLSEQIYGEIFLWHYMLKSTFCKNRLKLQIQFIDYFYKDLLLLADSPDLPHLDIIYNYLDMRSTVPVVFYFKWNVITGLHRVVCVCVCVYVCVSVSVSVSLCVCVCMCVCVSVCVCVSYMYMICPKRKQFFSKTINSLMRLISFKIVLMIHCSQHFSKNYFEGLFSSISSIVSNQQPFRVDFSFRNKNSLNGLNQETRMAGKWVCCFVLK